MRRRFAHIVALLALCVTATRLMAAPPVAAGDDASATRWYIVTLNGSPVGWTSAQTRPIEGGFRTDAQTKLRMAREKQILSMATTAWIEEDAAGRPLRGGQSQTGGGMSSRVAWDWIPEGIRERRTQGATVSERVLPPIDAGSLPPAAAQRMLRDAAAQERGELVQLLLDPSQGVQPSEVRSTRVGRERVTVDGKAIECTRWKSKGPQIPMGSEEWTDASGGMVQSQTPTGLGVLRSLLCTEAEAVAALDDAKPPVEVMVASFVKIDHPLADVLNMRSASLRVRARKPPIAPPPQEGFQRVKRSEDGSFEVTIDLDRPAEPALAGAATDAAYMESSPLIDWKDPAVLALRAQAIEKAGAAKASPAERAAVLRAAAAAHITSRNLASAFDSASEAARSRAGDCTEFAVLLAALLRADGIPSRVAAGLVWADFFAGERNVYAWHLWTQALIDGRWIDLDATLPPRGPSFHAGHLLLAVTPLRDAAGDPAWASLLTSMGNLSIEVRDGSSR